MNAKATRSVSSSRGCRSDVASVLDTRLRVDPKVTLHPASFDGALTDDDGDGQSGSSPDAGPSSASGSSTVTSPKRRRTFRDKLDDGTNPFAPTRRDVRAPGNPPLFRRELYPGYDEAGRRIGLDHLRGQGPPHLPVGHYRQHVHEYDAARGHQLPIPAQQTVYAGEQRRVHAPQEGPVFPAHEQFTRNPHELLGIPPHLPLDLSSLRDPPPGKRPQYHHHILAKLAILSSPSQRATLQEILAKIKERFAFYRDISPSASKSFGDNIRHLLSLHRAFVRKPKPATEPGKGSYWTLDLSLDGLKRKRKRNTRGKKVASKANEKGKKRGEGNTATSPDSRQPAHWAGSDAEETEDETNEDEDDDEAAFIQEPTIPLVIQAQEPPALAASRRSRPSRPIVNSTPEVSRSNAQRLAQQGPVHLGLDLYSHIDPSLMREDMQDTGITEESQSGPTSIQRYVQHPVEYRDAHTSSIGARRERISRGMARSSPYPMTSVRVNEVVTSTETDQSPSPVDVSASPPVDGRASSSPLSMNAPVLHPHPKPFHGGCPDPGDRHSTPFHADRRYFSSESPSPFAGQTSLLPFSRHRIIHTSPLPNEPQLPPPAAPDTSCLSSGPYLNNSPHFGAQPFPSPGFGLSGSATNSNPNYSQPGFSSNGPFPSLFVNVPQAGSATEVLPPLESLVRRDGSEARATSEPFTRRQLRPRPQP
ncbi:hypothetical protein EW145_g2203 [Phellinidium pouzarii]|uniref:Fork-head domain-containing protein n=1 Tax=Phellinidium pouzarii TaxID=167371 RepID=A0A4S4LDK5_9AGAM|nr:hypothetical protein EW145_g2203 [Phellinidium pouzarii]